LGVGAKIQMGMKVKLVDGSCGHQTVESRFEPIGRKEPWNVLSKRRTG
jgi:hypothetical protein